MAVLVKAPVTSAAPAAPTTAIMVCHGMGQQVRFETLDSVAAAILSQAAQTVSRHAGIVQSADGPLARSELLCTDRNGKDHNIHLYEAYWAPLTEGQIGLKETFQFLWEGGKRGLIASGKGHLRRWLSQDKASGNSKDAQSPSEKGDFTRWLFQDMRQMQLDRGTGSKIAVALLAIILLFAVIIGWSVSLFLLVGWVVHSFWEGKLAFAGMEPCTGSVGFFWILIWIIAGWGLRQARNFLIQYSGDVAIYVSAYKVSRFHDIRHKIQLIGLNVAKTVYAAHYDRVIILGHSLGSVVAYDTLNAMINEDVLTPGAYNVRQTTRALITCGSPLDKTAFIFRTQIKEDCPEIREALASAMQPLIVDYAFRTIPIPAPTGPSIFEWVNVYASQDVIGGSLEYYDYLPPDGLQVRNVKDLEARNWLPIKAHTDYWNRSALRRELWNAIIT